MPQFEHAIFYCPITSDCSTDTGQMISFAAFIMCYGDILLNDLFSLYFIIHLITCIIIVFFKILEHISSCQFCNGNIYQG